MNCSKAKNRQFSRKITVISKVADRDSGPRDDNRAYVKIRKSDGRGDNFEFTIWFIHLTQTKAPGGRYDD